MKRPSPMRTLLLVLGFPVILTWGYGCAYLLMRRDRNALVGPVGFVLYLVLLAIPLVAVLFSDTYWIRRLLRPDEWSLFWIAVGILSGLLMAGFQALTLPGQSGESRVWTGPPGWVGFILLMVPVAYIVVAEEIVWRGYLTLGLATSMSPPVGLLAGSGAFALHHYFFGLRHMVFAFAMGILLGSLMYLEQGLYSAIVAHFVYNAFAWAWLRHQRAAGERWVSTH